MKAIVQREFGGPETLELEDVERPEPGADEVLVRVRAASVGAWVAHMIRADPHFMRLAGAGLRRPKRPTPGSDFAGVVEAVGRDVTHFQPGDEVYGEGEGAFAEYVVVPEGHLALKPTNLTFEEAAALPVAGGTALLGLRDNGRVKSGDKVLIIGAAGGVGTFAVQIAKTLGAEVTGVCSTKTMDVVRSLGADHVIDYSKQDLAELTERYDVILQVGGSASPRALRNLLTPKGRLVLSSGEGGSWIGPLLRLAAGLALSPFGSRTVTTFYAAPKRENFEALTELVEAGDVLPVLDRTFTLADTEDALRRFEGGHGPGKIVVTI